MILTGDGASALVGHLQPVGSNKLGGAWREASCFCKSVAHLGVGELRVGRSCEKTEFVEVNHGFSLFLMRSLPLFFHSL